MPVPTGEFYDSKQCAAELGVHEITLVVWRRENRGPPWLSGPDAKIVLYDKAAVRNWLVQHTPPPPSTDMQRMIKLRAKAGVAERVEFETNASNRTVRDAVSDDAKRAKTRRVVKRPIKPLQAHELLRLQSQRRDTK